MRNKNEKENAKLLRRYRIVAKDLGYTYNKKQKELRKNFTDSIVGIIYYGGLRESLNFKIAINGVVHDRFIEEDIGFLRYCHDKIESDLKLIMAEAVEDCVNE